MRIHHLNCATLCPYGRRLLNGTGSIFEEGRLVCHCLLLEARDRLILVDTGFGTDDLRDPYRRLGYAWVPLMRPRLDFSETAVQQLRRLGFGPRDVTDIVLTHLDMDHAGGLSDFPRARVHVSTPEYDTVGHMTLWKLRRYTPSQWAHHPHWVLHRPIGESWFGFTTVRAIPEVDPEVLLIPLPGHSVGHCGVAVSTDDGWLLHAGDAYFHHAEISPRGKVPIGIRAYQQVYQASRRRRLENQARLRDLHARRSDTIRIICSHDPVYFDRLSARARWREMAEAGRVAVGAR